MGRSMYQQILVLFSIILANVVTVSWAEVEQRPASLAASGLRENKTPSVSYVYQPALIGFRCEGPSYQTLDGVSVIEANTPVRITLFGEAFTTNTIVAFTTEQVEDQALVDHVISANLAGESDAGRKLDADEKEEEEGSASSRLAPMLGRLNSVDELDGGGPRGADGKLRGEAVSARVNFSEASSNGSIRSSSSSSSIRSSSGRLVRSDEVQNSPGVSGRVAARGGRSARFERRLLTKSYDCTDLDRVISYKLSEENIITPNIAVLTVRLPELDWSSSGEYYYFCLKQPAVPSRQLAELELASLGSAAPGGGGGGGGGDSHGLAASAGLAEPLGSGQLEPTLLSRRRRRQQQQQLANGSLGFVWVHQGAEWWLTLKVEPPILSVTNDCVLIVLLLFLSAVTSGLNLGLMSLDMNELAVISSCGDQRERSYARTIAPLRKRGNYLLCSLLLGNVMVNSTLTIILEEMTSGVVAVIGSTLAIVVLGEIVPQAFCARQGLAIGAKTIYLTYAFMLITFPLSYPISCLLDCVLGEEKGNVYDRERLMEFIRITGNHTQLEADEVAIISGALKLKKIKVDQIMTRIEDVFMLPIDCMLNRDTIRNIIEKGYSRIPVYDFGDRKQIVALILAKDLALLDPDDQVPLASMLLYCKHPLVFIEDTATLDVALNEFKTGKSHMAIVRQLYDDGEVDKYYEAIGVVTLEDVIEEVLQTEINDETDTLSDNRRKRRRTDAQVSHLIENLAQHPTPLSSAGPNASTKF